jgi:hypothetical protein
MNMKRTMLSLFVAFEMALAIACQAGPIPAPHGVDAISLDGKSTIAIGMDVTATQYDWGVVASGRVNIMAWFGPFRGIALAQAATVHTIVLDDGSVQSVVRTGRFSYTDLTNWVPGYSSGIKYYWATAEVTVVVGKRNLAGFNIYRSDTGQLIASVPLSPVVAGNMAIY